jgi:ABC-type nitrate/sulfonate/bicarbonate transport system permease component
MGLLMIGLIGLATDFLLRLLTRILVPWYKRLSD